MGAAYSGAMRALPTLLTTLLCLWAAPSAAQDSGADPEPPAAVEPTVDPFDEFEAELGDELPVRREQGSEKPLELMTRDELDEAGFNFGGDTTGDNSSAALLLSLTAGTAIHGIGHLYLGDRRTGWFLLGLEGVSVGLMFSAASFIGLTGGASPWASAFGPMLQAGIAGFVFSYLADVIGVLTKGESDLSPNTSVERGVGFRLRYGLLNAVGLPARHAIDARLAVDVGGVYGSASTTQDVFLDLASYRAILGVRPLRGQRPLTFLGLEARGDYLQWTGLGEFGRIGAQGRLVGSYQLGDQFPHLSELAFGATTGVANHWIQLAPRGTTTFELASTRLWIPFDIWSSLNVSSSLNVRAGFGSPDVLLVPPIGRLLGVGHFTLTYRSSSYGDISLGAEIGDGLALWLGGGLWFGR